VTTPAPETAEQPQQPEPEPRTAPAITCDRRVRTGLCKATFTLPALPLAPSIPDWPLDGPDSGSYAALKQAAVAAGWTCTNGEWLCPEHQGGTPWWPAGDSGTTGAAGSLPHPLGAGLTVPSRLPKRIPQAVSPEDLPGPDRPRSMGAQGELIRAGEPDTAADIPVDRNGPETASPQASDSVPEDITEDKDAAADEAERQAKAYLARVAPGRTFDSQPGDEHTDTAITRLSEAHDELDGEGKSSTEGDEAK
jgi:hypothetical protein